MFKKWIKLNTILTNMKKGWQRHITIYSSTAIPRISLWKFMKIFKRHRLVHKTQTLYYEFFLYRFSCFQYRLFDINFSLKNTLNITNNKDKCTDWNLEKRFHINLIFDTTALWMKFPSWNLKKAQKVMKQFSILEQQQYLSGHKAQIFLISRGI